MVDATPAAVTAGTSWAGNSGSRLEYHRRIIVQQLAQAKATSWIESGSQSDAAGNEGTWAAVNRQTVATILDGFRFDFSGMGTFTDISVTIDGLF